MSAAAVRATAPPYFAFLVAGLSMIGPFSIDTYLPAFPAMAESLGATPLEVQQTLTAYMLPFAVMILWHGALSDALGRRPVILAGLGLYVAASLLCAFAGGIEVLWLGRALQGLVAGAGLVVSRAMIRDLLDGPQAQRLMAQAAIMFALAPALAPVIGGWIHAAFHWHGIFLFLAGFGGLMLALCARFLPETLPPEKRQPLRAADMARAYRQVFGHPVFRRLSMTLAFNFNGMFIYVLSAPAFLMGHLGIGTQGFAWLSVPAILGLTSGSWLSGRLAGRLDPGPTIGLGVGIMVLSAAGNVVINVALPPGLPWSLAFLPVYTLGMALAMPSLQLLALDLFPERRGMAASCQGAIQTGLNVLTAGLVAPLAWVSPLHLALASSAFLAIGVLAFSLSGEHRGQEASAVPRS